MNVGIYLRSLDFDFVLAFFCLSASSQPTRWWFTAAEMFFFMLLLADLIWKMSSGGAKENVKSTWELITAVTTWNGRNEIRCSCYTSYPSTIIIEMVSRELLCYCIRFLVKLHKLDRKVNSPPPTAAVSYLRPQRVEPLEHHHQLVICYLDQTICHTEEKWNIVKIYVNCEY